MIAAEAARGIDLLEQMLLVDALDGRYLADEDGKDSGEDLGGR